MKLSEPGEHSAVGTEVVGSWTAGHDDDVRADHVVEDGIHRNSEELAVRTDDSYFVSDEHDRRVWESL